MAIPLELLAQVEQRWKNREKERTNHLDKIKRGEISDIEPSERMAKRVSYLERYSQKERKRNSLTTQSIQAEGAHLLQDEIGLERIMGKRDFLGTDFMELAVAVSRHVCRVKILNENRRVQGFGTGFMVSPNLLITNNHVLSSSNKARVSEIEFDYQVNRFGSPLPVESYRLRPDLLFMTDKKLDFSLIAVAETSQNNVHIRNYGWSRLVGEQGKALLGDSLNIVQHPQGRPKEIAIRSNELIDLLPQHAHYLTDTEPGSSGSPVYNDQWEVVALHHAGVPRIENGKVVEWVANEGIRVSSIVSHVKNQNLNSEEEQLIKELLEAEPPDPVEVARNAKKGGSKPGGTSVLPAGTASLGSSSWVIPLHVNISFGSPHAAGPNNDAAPSIPDSSPPAIDPDAIPLDEEASIRIFPGLEDREGYQQDFLGRRAIVSLPSLNAANKKLLVKLKEGVNHRENFLLDYEHFSVAMNGKRMQAFYTAVNIDGAKDQGIKRGNDRWFYDPRIERSFQAGNDIYKSNPLDRGHLVRRLDPAWGITREEGERANNDTFHWTNCSPQHEKFNRNKTTWGGMENHILDNLDDENKKACVFTGAVFNNRDPLYRGIQLPLEYWKVIVIRKNDGDLSATAYLLSQEALIDELPEEEFVFGRYKTYQTKVSKIEKITGMKFGKMSNHDPLEGLAASESQEMAGEGIKELLSSGDAII